MNSMFRIGSLVLAVLLLCFTAVSAQDLTVSGSVVTDEGADPLPGVDVQVAGTYLGTTTDVDGNFTFA